MKKYILIFLIFFLPSISWAACPAGTCTLADCEYATVNTAVNTTATHGDIVTCPTDAADWGENTLRITKGITLQGNGIGNTVITSTANRRAVVYLPDSTSVAGDIKFRVTGFTFTGAGGIYLCDSLNCTGSPVDSGSTPKRNIIIDHNRFVGQAGSSYTSFYSWGSFWGVVYSNQFAGGTAGQDQYAIGVIGRGITSFNDFDDAGELSFGTVNSLYFEDNTFESEGKMFLESGNGGRWTFRYNATSGTTSASNAFLDAHGCQTSGNPGLMMSEAYGNIFTWVTGPTNGFYYQRGGRGLVFNNRGTYNTGTFLPYQEESYAFTGCDPASCCIVAGGASIVYPNNSYFFNNWGNGALINATINADDGGHLGANVSMWNYNANALNGSTQKGINCGSDAPTMTASEGDGYWQTTFSPCATPPTDLADMKTYIQAGKLWKYTGGAWAVDYTPYEYPHPLRGEGGVTYFDLTVTKPTFGTITSADTFINCGTGGNLCSYTYASTDSAVLTFTPSTGYYLSAKNCAGITTLLSPQTVAMSEARSCSATFTNGRAATIGTGGTMTIGTGGTATVSP